ncbi:hypothetical protein JCM10369A_28230 [Nocardioides pyridinolyticus]
MAEGVDAARAVQALEHRVEVVEVMVRPARGRGRAEGGDRAEGEGGRRQGGPEVTKMSHVIPPV